MNRWRGSIRGAVGDFLLSCGFVPSQINQNNRERIEFVGREIDEKEKKTAFATPDRQFERSEKSSPCRSWLDLNRRESLAQGRIRGAVGDFLLSCGFVPSQIIQMNLLTGWRGKLANVYYGWIMVGVVSAMRVLGGGLHGYGFTVFFLPVSTGKTWVSRAPKTRRARARLLWLFTRARRRRDRSADHRLCRRPFRTAAIDDGRGVTGGDRLHLALLG